MSEQPTRREPHADKPTGRWTPEAGQAIASRVAVELERRLAEPPAPGLHLVATPIGNLGDISLRALAVLARADVVCCEDTRHSGTLLAHFGLSRPLRPYHDHNGDRERPRLLAAIARGKSVALISDAGTPLVSDPGYKLVRDCLDAGLAVTAIPGPSAVMCAIAVAGLPTDQFHFAGFLPQRDGQRRTRLAELARIPSTVVVFEAPNRLAATLADIEASLGDRAVVVARELTKRFEEIRRGTAAEVAAWALAEPPRGEVVVLIGPQAERDVTDAEIADAMAAVRDRASGLKDAARLVADELGIARSRAYEIGLRSKAAPQ